MRTLTFAALIASLAITAGPGEAQRLGTNGARSGTVRSVSTMQPRAGGWNAPRPAPSGNWNNNPRPTQPGNWNNTPRPGNWNNHPRPNPAGGWNNQPRPSRWGNKIGGHWYAGHNAPGGWNGYHRPTRGWTLPSYWIAPSFYISDFSSYGLSSPPYGYNWTRYYDDAVLMDQRGQVWDSVSGLDWDRYDGNGYDDSYPDGGYYDDGGQGGGYAPERQYYQRQDNGVGGAVIGGVVGGVAGNLVAGRGNRTAGTLIGAGVGAVAGYAIDKNEDRNRRAPPAYSQDYAPNYGAGYSQPQVAYGRPAEVVQGGGYPDRGYPERHNDGSRPQGGYVSGGYWYPPVTTTTVTIGSTPVETVTTTTEYIDTVSYTAPRKTYAKKKAWRPRPKPRQCVCNCGC